MLCVPHGAIDERCRVGEALGRLRLLIIHVISRHGKIQPQLGVFLWEVDLRPIETIPVTLLRAAARWTRVFCLPKFVMPHLSTGQRLRRCNACRAFTSQKFSLGSCAPELPRH